MNKAFKNTSEYGNPFYNNEGVEEFNDGGRTKGYTRTYNYSNQRQTSNTKGPIIQNKSELIQNDSIYQAPILSSNPNLNRNLSPYKSNDRNFNGSYVAERRYESTSKINQGGNFIPTKEDRLNISQLKAREFKDERLKKENNTLKSELHRLKKIEAGWALSNTDNEKLKEQEYIAHINDLTFQLKEAQTKVIDLMHENESLIMENKSLVSKIHEIENEKRNIETEKIVMNKEIERNKNTVINKNVEINKTEIVDLRNHIGSLKAENESLRREIESKKGTDPKINKVIREKEMIFETKITQLAQRTNELEYENKRLQDQLYSTQEQANLLKEQNKGSARDQNVYISENRQLKSDLENAKRSISDLKLQKDEINSINDKIRRLNDYNKELVDENNNLKSKVMKLEIDTQQTEKKVCTQFHSSNEDILKEHKKLIQLYMEKIKDKEANNENLLKELESIKSENQKLKLLNNERDIKAEFIRDSVSKKESQSLQVIQIKTDQLTMENDYFRAENQKLRELLNSMQNNTVTNKVDFVREFKNGVPVYQSYSDSVLENLALKFVISQYEIKRLSKNPSNQGFLTETMKNNYLTREVQVNDSRPYGSNQMTSYSKTYTELPVRETIPRIAPRETNAYIGTFYNGSEAKPNEELKRENQTFSFINK